ncbi:MAG TPA: oligosaccharide flippase family protein [Chitinophagales bacterium]|nr:oligosaccharide flippase family protein [Chitinophagales bacterium]HRK26772.1 oligosaccharide flippase family protein [Chitinophagales bacterium]
MRTQDLIKKLAGLTAIYGLSSIIGRLLNYLLTPLLTRVFTQGEYGIITELYSYSGFLLVLFVYGMETAFFWYVKSSGKTAEQVYSTVMWSIIGTTALLVGLTVGFAPTIAGWINYPNNAEYVVWFAFIVGLDTLSAIPFALLRYQERAWRFALIRLTNIGVNIGLVLFFLLLCPVWADKYSFIGAWYVPQLGVGYVFIANLIAGAVTLLLLLPQLLQIKLQFDAALWRQMLVYALPLVVVGFAGIVNEMLDRVMLKYLLPYDAATNQAMLGVYGACYKLSILMSLFTQAYRFAAEPLFFAQAERQHAPYLYAQSMKFFVIAGVVIFMGVMLFLDIFQHFIGKDFRVGLPVVPYLLMANLFLGIYYNLSIWYKLSGKTHIGAYISVAGAFITIALNLLLVPQFGYLGAAWATLACYMAMCVLSYYIGGRYFPIPYNTSIITAYIVAAVLVVVADDLWLTHLPYMLAGVMRILLITLFLVVIYLTEKRHVTA